MPKNHKPKMFKPPLEDETRVANELSKFFSRRVGVGLSDGSVIRGKRAYDKKEMSSDEKKQCLLDYLNSEYTVLGYNQVGEHKYRIDLKCDASIAIDSKFIEVYGIKFSDKEIQTTVYADRFFSECAVYVEEWMKSH